VNVGFKILEQFVEGKLDSRVCEDLIVVTNDFAAVIDGASDESGARFAGKSGGKFAADVIAYTIEHLPIATTSRGFADALTDAVASAVRSEVGALGPDTRWPTASVVCCSAQRQEVWRVGDCNVVVGGRQLPGAKRVDEAAYSFRAAVNAAARERGMTLAEIVKQDPGAKAARPLFDAQQHLANKPGPWGYGCINGHRVPKAYVEVYGIPVGATVIMTTDGFPIVHPTLMESEQALTELMRRDPAAIGELWPMGKSTKPGAKAPDDRAYLRFNLQ
jgi:hypothetical protein